MSEIYKRIRARRIELGLSQDELAKKMGYKTRSSINKIEMGGNDIPQSKVRAFAKALDTTVAYLIGISPENEQAEAAIWEKIKADPRKLEIAIWMAELDSDTFNRVDKILTAAFER